MAESLTAETLLYALLGGILPAIFWLWFWLREDRHPEPRSILVWTFLAGMLIVPIAFVAERVLLWIAETVGVASTTGGIIALLFIWAFIEEILKYFAAKYAALRRKSFDEPVDALIYLITAALGFAAMENVLFLIRALETGALTGFMTSGTRFLGANLLHTGASAIVGASIGLSFFNRSKLRRNLAWGLFFATITHFVFNYFLILNGNGNILKILAPLWLLIISIILVFEKIKRVKKQPPQPNKQAHS